MAKTDSGNRERAIFEAALDIASAEGRLGYLKGACGEDAALLARVQALLQAHEAPEDFLPEQPKDGPTIRVVAEKAGDKIGHYKLREQIGEGGCGVVYMAEQVEPLHRRVALKIIKLGMDSKHVIARFEAERQALALMEHPNIAKVLDAGATDTGRPYFVMELVRGVKITDYCDENQLSTEERLNLFVQVCHAIQHAHQKGIIHRDIKPSNILVTLNDGVRVPKVIDFGIAKAIGQQLTDKTVFTAFEQLIGTPAYMSPEQAVMTSLDVDTRSDIYALGVLLYELLTGHTPFDQKELVAAGLDEMRRIIREREPDRPSTRLSTLADPEQTTVAKRRHSEPPQLIHLVRGDLDWIVMKCLEKDRSRRYETANGLADDVMRHLEDQPVVARPPGRVYRLQKLVRRNRLVFAAGAAVVGALVVGLGLSTWLFFREQAARRQAVNAEQVQKQLRQQAQTQAAKSEQVAQFLKDMLKGVGPSVALGRDTAMLKEILDKTAERVSQDLTNQPEVEAELRSIMGDVYFALNQFTNAATMHQAALAIRRHLWGNLNTNVADSLDGLARALQWQDWQPDQAEPLLQKALSIRTNLLGPEHPAVAASLFNLGWARAAQFRIPEAERLFRESLAMRRKLLGNDHVEVARSLSALAFALYEQDRFGESEDAARQALAIQARLSVGEPIWDDEATRARLGFALYRQHKLDEAEVVLRQAVKLNLKVLGTEHGGVIDSLSILALVLIEKGELEEAETLARKAVATSKSLSDSHYLESGHALSALGRALRKAGKLGEAESAFREELAVWEQHPDTFSDEAGARSRLITVLREQGKLAELESFCREELAAPRRGSGDMARKREVLMLSQWGDFLRDQGRGAEAEPLYRQGLALYRESLTNDFSLRQRLTGSLAGLLKNQGKLAEAEAFYREAVTNAARVWPNDFKKWEWQFNDLVDVLQRQGKTDEQEALYREGLGREQKLPASTGLAKLLAILGDKRRDAGKPAEAEPLYREGLDLCRKVAPDDFEQRQWLAAGLALVLRSQGKLAEAEAFYREAVTNAAKVWPDNPARWQWQVNDLADVLQRQGKSNEVERLRHEVLPAALPSQPPEGTSTNRTGTANPAP